MLEGGKPFSRATIDRVIQLTNAGGYVDRVLDDAVERIRIAEKAADRIPDESISPVLHTLDRYLLERVETART